ncbi:MAG TPA: transporter [Burkholderiales bacterium]
MSTPPARHFAAAGLCLALFAVASAHAQNLEPRAYLNTPVGMNFLIAGYTYSSGGLSTDPALPLTNAKLDIHTPFVAYAHAFDAWGKSAKFDAVVGGGCLDGTADSNGVPVSRDVCGLLDPTMRVSVNFYGAPALEAKDFTAYRQDVIVGASLQVQAPLGQYDATRLVNLGSNRWALRPEVGLSKVLYPLLVEATLGATFYTANDGFFGGQTREQDPVVATQLHLIYLLRAGAWIAFDATYYSGGQTALNGVKQNDELGNSRLGLTFSYPWDRQHSIKLYASEGISVRYGTDFNVVGLAWQYRWGGGL